MPVMTLGLSLRFASLACAERFLHLLACNEALVNLCPNISRLPAFDDFPLKLDPDFMPCCDLFCVLTKTTKFVKLVKSHSVYLLGYPLHLDLPRASFRLLLAEPS